MLKAALHRGYCRTFHRGLYLAPSATLPGTLRCARCGAGFQSFGDDLFPNATISSKDTLREITNAYQERAWFDAAVTRQGFLPTGYRIIRGGEMVKSESDLSGRRCVGGETIRRVNDDDARRETPLLRFKRRHMA